MSSSEKWDRRFMDMARLVASWSKDPSSKVGAVITRGKFVVSVGFNGFPQGVEDLPERLENREIKYPIILHAEINAILSARQDIRGCSLYVTPYMPCPQCAAVVVQSGISRIVYTPSSNEKWGRSPLSETMFSEAGIELVMLPPEASE
ncbi:deoxycytidylate deaminase [Telmatobacter bradus]|uniref:deoxycytidylate deaminase n=1 Tax=Telmatobacter bradus TaxID=474953 RepID=UPI003B4390A7